jgi:hypothetical protein
MTERGAKNARAYRRRKRLGDLVAPVRISKADAKKLEALGYGQATSRKEIGTTIEAYVDYRLRWEIVTP